MGAYFRAEVKFSGLDQILQLSLFCFRLGWNPDQVMKAGPPRQGL